MKILILEQDEDLCIDIVKRIEEAGRRTSLKGISIVGSSLRELGSFIPELIFVGPFAVNSFEDVSRRLHGMFPRVPISLLLNSEDYVSEAIDIRRRHSVRIVALGDIPQMAQVIFDVALGGARGNVIGPRGRVLGLTHTKGGVGATSLAASFAAAAASRKVSTVLIDFSVVNPDITLWSNYGIAAQSALKKAYETSTIGPSLVKDILEPAPDGRSNLHILGQLERYIDAYRYHIDNPELGSGTSDMVEKLIDSLSQEFELVVIDLGNHWGVATLSALAVCTHVFFVVDEAPWSFARSVQALRRISAESEDPSEFDYRKWSILVNGCSHDSEAAKLLASAQMDDFFISKVNSFGVPLSKRGADWLEGNRTLYDNADKPFQIALDEVLKSVIPASLQE